MQKITVKVVFRFKIFIFSHLNKNRKTIRIPEPLALMIMIFTSSFTQTILRIDDFS